MSISGARMNWRIDSRTIRAGAQRAHGTSRLRMFRPISAPRVAALRPSSALRLAAVRPRSEPRLAAVRPSSVLFPRARLTRSARPLPMLHYVPQFPPGGYSVGANLACAPVQLGPGRWRVRDCEPERGQQQRHHHRGGDPERVPAESGAPALLVVADPEQL